MAGGYKTGMITTANIKIGATEMLNSYHMTMPGRFVIQGLMARMVTEGCTVCLVETTSEGLKQFRHIGISYDMAVFTNLTPEHLPSHGGSFERYKQAKGRLFAALAHHRKVIAGTPIDSVIIANRDSEHAPFYLDFTADKKITFGISNTADYVATDIHETEQGVSCSINDIPLSINSMGRFNVYNILPAVAIARHMGVSTAHIQQGLNELTHIPGRMEVIRCGQPYMVIVDYAHEQQSITGVLATARTLRTVGSRIIIVVGAEGGGRDKMKRPIMGQLAGTQADCVVVTTVDPYDDDPVSILEDIAVVAERAGKVRNTDMFVIEDRRAGITKALSVAKAGDIVLITGKGAEQSMIVRGAHIPWDDRTVVREELKRILGK